MTDKELSSPLLASDQSIVNSHGSNNIDSPPRKASYPLASPRGDSDYDLDARERRNSLESERKAVILRAELGGVTSFSDTETNFPRNERDRSVERRRNVSRVDELDEDSGSSSSDEDVYLDVFKRRRRAPARVSKDVTKHRNMKQALKKSWMQFRSELVRRKKKQQQMFTVRAYSVCKEFDVAEVFDWLKSIRGEWYSQLESEGKVSKKTGNKLVRAVKRELPITQYTDCAYAKTPNDGDIFVLSYGSVVFWNVAPETEKAFLGRLLQIGEQVLAPKDVEMDDFDYFYGASPNIHQDTICLATHTVLEKLACSFALAQSVTLSVFEEMVDNHVAENRHLAQDLASDGKINLSAVDISKRIGLLFMHRSDIFLHTDILDTPEFFWENDEHLSFFKRIAAYLEIEKRTDILNRRLEILKELLDMLSTEVDQRHASKLEWIIIWLILLEVVIEVLWNMVIKDILHLVSDC